MQTFLPDSLLATDAGSRANSILRDCVHCGFCNATCPTYQVERNELDGPRGRIYLVKQMLEGEAATAITRHHLDRCLLCRACETTCPSGVSYHELLQIGRAEALRQAPRSLSQRTLRWLLRHVMTRRGLTRPLFGMARLCRPLLPASLRAKVPAGRPAFPVPSGDHRREVVLAQGCVQPGMSPTTNQAAAVVLDALGIAVLSPPAETCCGALAWHGEGEQQALQQARRNIDAWWAALQDGAEAILFTASGCSLFSREYEKLFAAEPAYAEKARQVSAAVLDVSEFLQAEALESLEVADPARIAWHCPCTAQHGQALDDPTRRVLSRLGFDVPDIADAHLCCGSAGSYSLFQPEMAAELRRRKLKSLEAGDPEQIVTANIGCQAHLAAGTDTPVLHWIELVARSMPAKLQQPVTGD